MLLDTGDLNSREELCIYMYVVTNNSSLECSTYWGEHIYIYIYIYTDHSSGISAIKQHLMNKTLTNSNSRIQERS